MTTLCPYCKAPMQEDAPHPEWWSVRRQRIYHAVLEAGRDGIASEDLLVRMYSNDEWPTAGGSTILRVNICEMNKELADYRQVITAHTRGRYRIISLEQFRYEKAQKKAGSESKKAADH